MLNQKNIKIITASFVILIVSIISYNLLTKESIYTDNAYLKADIVIIRPKVNGFITEVMIQDNQQVKAGDILAKIDDQDYKWKLLEAQANLDASTAKLNAIKEQLQLQKLTAEKANTSLNRINKDLKRAKILIKDHAISQTALEKNQELQKNAQLDYDYAIQSLKVIESQVLEIKSLVQSYTAILELAKIDLDNTSIKALTDGKISKRNLQIGQLASPNLALAYLVSDNIWVSANFKEVQINKIKPNQEVIVKIDSIPNKKFMAKVDSFSPATGSEFSILPPENATGNFTKIVQRLPIKITFNEQQDLSLLKPGFSCEVRVFLD